MTSCAHKGCKIVVTKKVFTDFFSFILSDLKTFTNKGCKLLRKKSNFFGEFCLTEKDFFGIGVSHSV